jgi:hypothetical protein
MEHSSFLDLESINFSNEEFKELCVKLYDDTLVTTLNLGYCELDDYCAIELAELLSHNKTIRYLELTNNNITTEGAIEISKALTKNTTLNTLSLTCNLIDSFKEVSMYLSRNTALTRIEINGNIRNKYSEYYYDIIFNIVNRNNIYLWYKPSVDTFNECTNLLDELKKMVFDSVLLLCSAKCKHPSGGFTFGI